MEWIKKSDKFLLSREELCTLADFETCLQFNKKKDRPANFDDEDIVKIRKDMYKVLGKYLPSFIKKIKKNK